MKLEITKSSITKLETTEFRITKLILELHIWLMPTLTQMINETVSHQRREEMKQRNLTDPKHPVLTL